MKTVFHKGKLFIKKSNFDKEFIIIEKIKAYEKLKDVYSYFYDINENTLKNIQAIAYLQNKKGISNLWVSYSTKDQHLTDNSLFILEKTNYFY